MRITNEDFFYHKPAEDFPVIWMIYKRVMSKGEHWYVEKALELLEALTNCDTTKY